VRALTIAAVAACNDAIEPSPPRRLQPPTTAAAIAYSS
jgi:hypothetical protein